MREFEQVFSLIHEGVQPQIDYNKFKEMLIDYVENLMKGILCGNANYVCRIEQLNKGHRGSEGYDSNTNTFGIIISDAVARSIYYDRYLTICENFINWKYINRASKERSLKFMKYLLSYNVGTMNKFSNVLYSQKSQ